MKSAATMPVTKTGTSAVDWAFVGGIWLVSRILISAFMLFAYHHAVAHGMTGPSPFMNWDGNWYERIALTGYSIVPDSQGHTRVAFFPLYPMMISGLVRIGFEPTLAGVILSNLAFLGTLAISYTWMKERFGIVPARWTAIVLAFSPYAVFTAVVYTESLFLLLTLSAIVLFDRGYYAFAGICGALASASRPVGIVLVPAMLYAWYKEKRQPVAAAAAIASCIGLLAFMVFQYFHFGSAFAFVHAQTAWVNSSENNPTWVGTLSHPYKLRSFLRILMVVAAAGLFYWARTKLPTVFLAFAVCALFLVIFSGNITSADRFVYGIAVFSMCLGLLFTRYRNWGYGIVAVSALGLCVFSVRFAMQLWVP